MAQNVDPAIAAANETRGKGSSVETSNSRDGHSVSKR